LETLGEERRRIEMEEKEAIKILDELKDSSNYVDLVAGETAILDGYFDREDLEAIAWWMKNKGRKEKNNGKRITA
jgi:hypothetical protein